MTSYYTLPTAQQIAFMQEGAEYKHSSLLLDRRAAAAAVYDRLSGTVDVSVKGYVPEITWDSLHLHDFHVAKRSLGNGVILCDIRTFVTEYSDIATKYIFAPSRAEANVLHAFMDACYNRGAVLYVPAGVHVPDALDIARLLGGYRQELLIDKLIVIVGERATVSINDALWSEHMAANTFLRSVEYHIADYAAVNVVYDQQLSLSVHELSRITVSCGKESSFECAMSITGCVRTKMWIDLLMAGEHATAHVRGIYALHESQKMNIATRQEHKAARASSTVAFKGGLQGSAQALFDGLIAVDPIATQTRASQHNHTILLSSSARSQSMPRLEVLTNDVRCSHGAAVGQLDANQILYLQSRGLTLTQAQKSMLRGFFSSLVGDELCKASIKKLCSQ